ncbi:MAG: polyprenyl synthetase family protein [Lentilitoribacter sp.]
MADAAKRVEAELKTVLSDKIRGSEIARPEHLMAAMRHGSLNGGKRLRPFLVMEAARLFDGNETAALRVATALECIHCYSLIHDDLPAMDDDDLRRGEPTVHIAFDEATAILAGDGLLTLAFDVIASDETPLGANAKIKLISELAQAAGLGGMVGGQALDLAAEKQQPDEAGILTLQQMKTGALIRFACQAGAIIGNADPADFQRMTKFGQIAGQAFQLADDLLDVTSDTQTMGKNTGKDADAGKATLVGLHGIEWAQDQLQNLAKDASKTLDDMNCDTEILRQTAQYIILRDR